MCRGWWGPGHQHLRSKSKIRRKVVATLRMSFDVVRIEAESVGNKGEIHGAILHQGHACRWVLGRCHFC